MTFESADQNTLQELDTTSFETSNDGEYKATWSPIESKSQSGTEASIPTPSAGSTFTRSVELRLGPHQPGSIWRWFQTATKCEAFPENPEETTQMDRLNEFFAQAEIDRQRVKAGIDAVRKQKEELKRAREAAARMANEE